MFKGKVYLYKNINGKEEKVEKDFINEEEFNKYIDKNPELKKMKSDFKKIKFPESFNEMKNFFDDFDKMFLGEKEKKSFFDDFSSEFKRIFEKSQKKLHK